ncbi:MAG: hypothetical protein FJY46_07100 [Betaproteobacteria bacterium]|nr:hypothetical protein [Betaproteobacteria bacterium]
MTEKLTPVEERFANEVALGKSQAAAYRIANPRSTKWKDGSVYVKASLMMGKDKVKKRIAEIQQLLLIRTLWSREQSVVALKKVIEAPDRKSDVVAAVRELNVMHGFHEAQKIEHSGAITSIERRIVDVAIKAAAGG